MTDRDRKHPAQGATRKRQRETAADRARLGSVIAGSYRIDEILGRGAIGAVFSGMHLRLERPVAVKFVDPTLVDDPEIRARFKREAKIAAQIGSSHAVEVFDYGLGEDGAPYLVMERLVGEDLHHRMQRDGRLSVDRALRIAKQVCRALGAAHANGIVHRDLKPENVFLVERDGESEFVKVVDFGLSTFVQSDDTRLTRAGQSVGTPLYMAPEQAGAHAFDARVDVYSLGVLIFEMTTGRLPFEAPTLQALLVALATQPPRSIRYYQPDLPIELDDLVLRFIARDPRVRPKTAAAALAEILALEERLANKPLSAPRKKDVAIDGLPGKLPGAFAQEVSGHLDEMRRTGSLSTSQVSGAESEELAPITEVERSQPIIESAPISSGGDSTRPMDRREISDLMGPEVAHSSDSIKIAPRAAGKPAAPKPQPSSPAKGTASTRPPAAERASQGRLPVPKVATDPDEIEEDSGVFYGRVGTTASPRPIQLNPPSTPPPRNSTATIPPAAPTRRGHGPPRIVMLVAFAAFLVVAILIAWKTLKG